MAVLFPDSSRAAAPVALRKVSDVIPESAFPNPVKTISFVFLPGSLITSSALAVAPIAFNVANSGVLSI